MSAPTDATKWPFLGITDESGNDLGWCGFAGPLRGEREHEQRYERLANRYRFIGFTSHGEYPNSIGHQYPCEAWCHGYRDPERRLPCNVPHVTISESDFANSDAINRARLDSQVAIDADYVVVALPGWPEVVKHPELARACTWQLHRMGLSGLYVGTDDTRGLPPGTKVVRFLPWKDLMATIARMRFVLFTSEIDASPRLITESICLNRPVIVNASLLQGWKYVAPETGEFFLGEHDVAAAAARCLASARRPHQWFHQHFGPRNAGARLHELLRRLQPSLPSHGIAKIVRTA